MRVRDLGALTVVLDAQEHPVTGARAAAMLALLAVRANQRVSVDALMSAAWGEHRTAGTASTLASHIWRLRQLLEPGRDRRQPSSVLLNDSDGYRLVCGPASLDSLQFAEATGEVRDLLVAGHPDAAIKRSDAALALWRGTPYGTFADAEWAQPAVARLEELRGQMQTRRIEALLAAGSVDAALSDLHPLVSAMPLQQSLVALQMQALHRSGRSEQALEAYRRARSTLIDELGIEPGRELQELQARILRDDLPSPLPTTVPSAAPTVEIHLPSTLTPLVGRDEVLGRLAQLVRTRRLVTISGPAGCGKTRVAVEVARAASDDFADGLWFVDLTSVTDPAQVAEVVISTIGFAGSTGATPAQDLRRYLRSRRMLVILDNCEHVLVGVDQVVRTVLAEAGSGLDFAILVTSREPIGIAGETIWALAPLELPGAGDGLGPAVELFVQRLKAAVPMLTVDERVLAPAADIVTALDGLPLPIELAAARSLSHSLDDIAAQVTADPGRLSRLGRAPSDHRATVRSAIEWSYRLLSQDEQQAHRRLAVLPGCFTSAVAAAVMESDGADTDDLLARLVHRSMLVSEGALGRDRRTVFRQLTTVRSHARHALEEAAETADAVDQRDRWTALLIESRPPLGDTAEIEWHRRIDDDYATVRATLSRLLIDQPAVEGARIAHQLTHYWYYRERLVEAGRWLQLGAEALRGGSPTDVLVSRVCRSSVHIVQRRVDLATDLLSDLETRVRAVPDDRRLEVGRALVVLALGAYVTEEPALLQRLHGLLVEVGASGLGLLVDTVGCCALLTAGRLEPAVTLALSVQERAERERNLLADYSSTAPLVAGALAARHPDEGLPWIDRCIARSSRLGTGSVGMFVETRANFLAQLGDYRQAARTYSVSRTATRRAGLPWPNRTWTAELLTRTRHELSRADYERSWQDGEQLSVADVVPGHAGCV